MDSKTVLAIIGGVAVLTASSWFTIPVGPVPITLQTLAVTVIGALMGWRLGAATVALWLIAAALGAPVLANGGAGLAKFTGPSAGYLFAFPIAAALTGWLAERGHTRQVGPALATMAAGNALCLAIGVAWLGARIGIEGAWSNGVAPFLIGAALKSLAGALIVRVLPR